jgi:UDP-N-acetylmuramoyl-L-alanyl-D-glutamate--2,6-diaminopimelate ligase
MNRLNIDRDITEIVVDSRKVTPGATFVALRGTVSDGHDYIEQAIAAGATTVVSENQVEVSQDVQLCVVQDSHLTFQNLCRDYYNNPFADMTVTAITGTNGKTTVSYFLEAIFQEALYATAVMGTINYRVRSEILCVEQQTTPSPLELFTYGEKMRDRGVQYLVVEASSHGLKQGRLQGIDVKGALFTNLTHDHLDYHETFEDYKQSKKSLFDPLRSDAIAVLNGEDSYWREMIEDCSACVYTYGFNSTFDLSCQNWDKYQCELCLPDGSMLTMATPLIGRHNIMNMMAAVTLAIGYEIEPGVIVRAMNNFSHVPGRLQKISESPDRHIFVDYAHTSDALEHVLQTLKYEFQTPLWLVFGCGGDRDRAKRSLMSKIAESYADHIYVTTDNSRSESFEQIIADIQKGFSNASSVHYIQSRKQAIQEVMKRAKQGDCILVAGKGHETYQEVHGQSYLHDDVAVIRSCL